MSSDNVWSDIDIVFWTNFCEFVSKRWLAWHGYIDG